MDKRKKTYSEIDDNVLNDLINWLSKDEELGETKFNELLEKLESYFSWNTLWDPRKCAYRTMKTVWQDKIKGNIIHTSKGESVESIDLIFLDTARNLEKVIDREILQSILKLLDDDENKAAIIYNEIFQDLIDYFIKRKIENPEECADKTFIRISTKVDPNGIIKSKSGDMTHITRNYVFGIARNIAYEYWRARKDRLVRIISEIKDIDEQLYEMLNEEDPDEDLEKECQRKCINNLKTKSTVTWETLSDYLTGNKSSRESQTKKLNISRNALSSRIKRIKGSLKSCAEKCIEEQQQNVNE